MVSCRALMFTGLMLFGGAAVAGSTNHTVTVGGGGNVFTPSSLTIQAGDTVTFTNAGGLHNVATDPGAVTSFRCAVDCTATGGNPSSTTWSFTVTFPDEGSVPYHCEIHGGAGGAGMSGTITVGPVPVELQSFDID